MTALDRIKQIAGAILKYGLLATAAVAEAQAQVGPSGGDAGLQATKRQLAIALVLGAAHAGESVDNSTVQTIAAVVELAAMTAKSLGAGGKTAAAVTVVVPAASKVE
jgi:hypothetical protein